MHTDDCQNSEGKNHYVLETHWNIDFRCRILERKLKTGKTGSSLKSAENGQK